MDSVEYMYRRLDSIQSKLEEISRKLNIRLDLPDIETNNMETPTSMNDPPTVTSDTEPSKRQEASHGAAVTRVHRALRRIGINSETTAVATNRRAVKIDVKMTSSRGRSRSGLRTRDEARHNDVCVICYSNIDNRSDKEYLPCSHYFHATCVNLWKKRSYTCPICRISLKSF